MKGWIMEEFLGSYLSGVLSFNMLSSTRTRALAKLKKAAQAAQKSE